MERRHERRASKREGGWTRSRPCLPGSHLGGVIMGWESSQVKTVAGDGPRPDHRIWENTLGTVSKTVSLSVFCFFSSLIRSQGWTNIYTSTFTELAGCFLCYLIYSSQQPFKGNTVFVLQRKKPQLKEGKSFPSSRSSEVAELGCRAVCLTPRPKAGLPQHATSLQRSRISPCT